jgi:hypothetical protein
MKFGEKYDLQESLTTGGVETFVANDKIRGERVLVHILHCDPQKPNQPTVQWVLESFRRLAPEPAGLVLETGRYSGTLYAYLVTKLPDEATLRRWVQQYESQARDTRETPAPVPAPTPPSQALAPDVTANQPPPVPGPVTQLLRSFESQSRPTAPSAPPKHTEQPSVPLPNISPAADQSSLRTAPPWSPERDPETPRISVPPRPTPDINRPSGPFRPDFTAKNLPAEPGPPPVNSPKPGEFTSFFQGPFRGDRPSDIPALSPSPSLPQEPPRKNVGDFTAMFGSVKPHPEEPPPSPGIAGNEPAGTGFTGWFTPEAPSRTSGTTTPAPAGLPRANADSGPIFPEPPKQPFIPPPPVSTVAPLPPIFPAPPLPIQPMPKPPAAAPSAQASDGATNAFSRPASEPAPAPPPPPSGPSPYTEIISVKTTNPSAEAEGGPKESPPPSASAPPMPTFKMPPPPPMPKIAAPLPPKAPIKAPKPPKVAIPEPPVSYWPLVLTLTALFFIAVLLVLYFVLKH